MSRSHRSGPLAVVAAALLSLGAALPAAAASPSPTASASPVPANGMATGPGCATEVSFGANGRRVVRPLPAPVSRVGGAVLAEPGLHVTAGATPPTAPLAAAWLVADADTGAVLAACNAHVPLAPASSLKTLTALALAPVIDPATRYTATAADAAVDGTRVGLVPGSVYTAADLWYALLMSSANDAATGLAALAGGTAAATARMTGTARSLGAADTLVSNTSGLDEGGQTSSAYDLALFGRAMLRNPSLLTIAQTRSYAFPEAGTAIGKGRKTFDIQNHDRLLYNYPGALGIKNGWTSTSGGSFVGAARRDGHTYLVTVVAAEPPTWHMAAALLDWAFATRPPGGDVGRLVDGPDPDGALPVPSAAAGAAPSGAAPSGAAPSGAAPSGVAATAAVRGGVAGALSGTDPLATVAAGGLGLLVLVGLASLLTGRRPR